MGGAGGEFDPAESLTRSSSAPFAPNARSGTAPHPALPAAPRGEGERGPPRSSRPETLRGLPGPLPEGEEALWQGSPDWRALARHALHSRLVAAYFGLLALWRAVEGLHAGEGLDAVAGSVLFIAALGAAVLGLIALYAWAAARTTIYTITTRRIVLTFGIALPVTLNLPFKAVGSAALKLFADGTGDIPVVLTEKRRLSVIVLWPHLRPWHFSRVQPMLRAIPDAAAVAELLASALAEAQASPHVVAAAQGAARSAGPAEDRHEQPAGLHPAAA